IKGLQRHPRYGARVKHRAYRNMYDALDRTLQQEGLHGHIRALCHQLSAPVSAVIFVSFKYTPD
ncbi:unnamed protein product, partial [Ilex paraguariensis]